MADQEKGGSRQADGTIIAIEVAFPTEMPLPQAIGANYFHFARVGNEYQMLVGTPVAYPRSKAVARNDTNHTTNHAPLSSFRVRIPASHRTTR
jgi:hypothetical protein